LRVQTGASIASDGLRSRAGKCKTNQASAAVETDTLDVTRWRIAKTKSEDRPSSINLAIQ